MPYNSGSIANFSSSAISDTYQRLVQTDGTYLADGTGSLLNNITIPGNLVVSGTLYAQNTVVVTQSFSSGSNILGDAVDDFQTLYGTVNIPTGSLTVTGSLRVSDGITGSFTGSGNITSASYARTSSFATTSSYAESSSFTLVALTASYVNPLSQSVFVSGSLTNTGSLFQSGSSTFNGGTYLFKANASGDAGIRIDNTINGYSSLNWPSNNIGLGLIAGGGLMAKVSSVGLNVSTVPVTATLGAMLGVRGSGTTSSTTALLVQNANTTASLAVLDNGFVGVGFLSPSYSLDVSGSARVTGNFGVNAGSSISLNGISGGNGLISGGNSFLQILNRGQQNVTLFNGGSEAQQGVQIGYGLSYNLTPPNLASAILELTSRTKGFLLPRTDLLSNIGTPAQGLQTYITASATEGIWYYNSGSYQGWTRVLNNSGSQNIAGNVTITGSASNSLLVKGTGTTSSTTSLLVQDSNGSSAFEVKDDRSATIYGPLSLSRVNQGFIYYSANDYIAFPRQSGAAPGYLSNSTAGDGWAFRLATNNQIYARIMEGSFYLEAYTPNTNGRNSLKTWFSGSNFVYIDGDGTTGFSPSYGNGVNIIIRGGKSGTYSNVDNKGAAGYVTVEGGSAFSGSFTTHVPAGGVNIQTGLGLGTGSAADLTFSTSTTSSVASTYHTQTQRMIVKGQTGFIGIGISSPFASLHVSGSGIFTGNVTITGSASNSLLVKGTGTTSSTTSLLVQDSNGATIVQVKDNKDTIVAGDTTISYGSGTRYIQSSNGSIGFFSSNSTGYTLWTQHNLVGAQGKIIISSPSTSAQSNTGVIALSTTPTDGVSSGYASELIIRPQVNHVPTFALIRGGDSAYGGNSTLPISIYLWGGKNTTNSTVGNIILAHNTTGSIGNVGIGISTPSASLHVSGSGIFTGDVTITGSLTVSGSNITSAWTSYTPTWEGQVSNPSLGNGTITGAYKVIGKTCFVRVKINFGSTTTGGSGAWWIGLPFTGSTADGIQMPCSMLDNGNAWYQGIANGTYAGFAHKTAIIAQSTGSNSSQGVSATFPITWGDTDSLQFAGSYEIA